MALNSVLIAGASGRLGAAIVREVTGRFPEARIWALVRQRKNLNDPVTGVRYIESLDELKDETEINVVIDATAPSIAALLAGWCSERKAPYACFSTGLDSAGHAALEAASAHIPVLYASNSLASMVALEEAALRVQAILGSSFHVSISERHHLMKRDAPSGTARVLAASLGVSEQSVRATREGSVIGEHRIVFTNGVEHLELVHAVDDRQAFGGGALRLTERLMHAPAGLYGPRDLLLEAR